MTIVAMDITNLILGTSSFYYNQQYSLNSLLNYIVCGPNNGDKFPSSVTGIGDINGNGYPEILIGAPNANYGVGISYLFLNKASWPGNIYLPNNNYISSLTGNTSDVSYIGWSVSGAGDFNRDGYKDFIIGTYRINSRAGAAYIIYGGSNFTAGQSFVNFFAMNGVSILGDKANDWSGYSVSRAGDVNGDGCDDIIL